MAHPAQANVPFYISSLSFETTHLISKVLKDGMLFEKLILVSFSLLTENFRIEPRLLCNLRFFLARLFKLA